MTYVQVLFDSGLQAYQEIDNGVVVRYLDLAGNELFKEPTEGSVAVELTPQEWFNA